MYGHIHMMKTRPEPLNMREELYMDILRESVIYWVSDERRNWAVTALRAAVSGEEKLAALEILLKVCITQSSFEEGLGMIDRVISDFDMRRYRVQLYFRAGEMSEGFYDYKRATGYYARSLASLIRSKEQHLAAANKLGFCSLYETEFQQAEEWCRWAIKLDSRSWEAWKNLGVSLEHQALIEEAFLAYFKAVFLSRGRVVPVMHITRLSQRHPGIIPDVGGLRSKIYRDYELIL
jgi:tetratricopeptide (TPR) repeat protein